MSRKPALQCTQFRCWRHGDRRCCVGCPQPCDHICYNAPDRCGLSSEGKARPTPHKGRFAEEQTELARLASDGVGAYEASCRLGLSRSKVYTWYRTHGYEVNPRKIDYTAQIRELYCEKRLSIYAIAKKLGRSYGAIAYQVRKMGLIKEDD